MVERRGLNQRRADYVETFVWPEIQNKLVLTAFQKVRQEDFLPANRRREAYISTIQLGYGSSMTDPKLTAQMMDHLGLTGHERVLEIGTATGFTAALLSQCALNVDTIEYQTNLAISAKRRLVRLGYTNITVHTGDGAQGLPDKAPFDAILVTAAARQIPERLTEQIAEGGRMVVPVGRDPANQNIVVLHRNGDYLMRKSAHLEVRFHPLISSAPGGWTPEQIQSANTKKWNNLLAIATHRGQSGEDLRKFLADKFGIPLEKVDSLVADTPNLDLAFLLTQRNEDGAISFVL